MENLMQLSILLQDLWLTTDLLLGALIFNEFFNRSWPKPMPAKTNVIVQVVGVVRRYQRTLFESPSFLKLAKACQSLQEADIYLTFVIWQILFARIQLK